MGFRFLTDDDAAVHASKGRPRRFSYERRIQFYALLLTLPGLAVGAAFLWMQSWSVSSRLLLGFLLVVVYWLLAMALHEHVARPLQTLGNVVAALKEDDYSFRVRDAALNDAFGGLSAEVNELADLLSSQRSQVIEATALLQRVVEKIEVPLFAFDPGQRLALVNPAGEKLLQKNAGVLLRKTAEECGLSQLLNAGNESVISLPAGMAAPQWLLRRSTFRQQGIPHTLVVLSDVSRVLREQERSAWQSLLRVLGHELNNSLAPIKSIAGTLKERTLELSSNYGEVQDFARGLEIIESRAGSLNRFIESYRRLAQMPRPVLRPTALAPLLRRVAQLETRLRVSVLAGPELTLNVDPDQIEQMLINLVRNGVEAAIEKNTESPLKTTCAAISAPTSNRPSSPHSVLKTAEPEVCIQWHEERSHLVIDIEDNGPGLANPANLFVPFYTTKPGGSGIGLVLSRQIVEAHRGTVQLCNREDTHGCRVRIALPGNHTTG